MKTFLGGIFIEKTKLKEAGIYHPIRLEYYKTINSDEVIKENKKKYGIEVIKTEYIENFTKVENKKIDYLTNDERKVDKILEEFKRNEVTPISVDYILEDMQSTKQFF